MRVSEANSAVLDLDIGNTFAKWRFGTQTGLVPSTTLTSQQLVEFCGRSKPQRVRLASVADREQQQAIGQWCLDLWGVDLEVARVAAFAAGVSNSYPEPNRMGVDRWLAMLAAYNRHKGPCCVVDCGSAITVDYVDLRGRHLGGYIMPGVRLMRTSLLVNTRRIETEQRRDHWGECSPGVGTTASVDNGICLMFTALAQRIGRDSSELLGEQAQLFICGGDGAQFQSAAGAGRLMPALVLDGLDYALP